MKNVNNRTLYTENENKSLFFNRLLKQVKWKENIERKS